MVARHLLTTDFWSMPGSRPIFHRQRDAIGAHLTIVFTALAVSHAIQSRTGLAIANLVPMGTRDRTEATGASLGLNGEAGSQSGASQLSSPCNRRDGDFMQVGALE